MNLGLLVRLLALEILFVGLVILLVTGVVRSGPLYWILLVLIALSAWSGVFAARRLFPRPSDEKNAAPEGVSGAHPPEERDH